MENSNRYNFVMIQPEIIFAGRWFWSMIHITLTVSHVESLQSIILH